MIAAIYIWIKTYPFLLFHPSLDERVHGDTSYGNGCANTSLCRDFVACSAQQRLVSDRYKYTVHYMFTWKIIAVHLPKTMIENPMTNTRFNTLPTACVRGATRSKVFVATCHAMNPVSDYYLYNYCNVLIIKYLLRNLHCQLLTWLYRW